MEDSCGRFAGAEFITGNQLQTSSWDSASPFLLRSCNRPENQNVVGLDCLAGATKIDMEAFGVETVRPGGPLNTVDKTQTIHRITNEAAWNEPAVSMHIYSLPIDSCVVFDLEAQRCYRRDLKYDY